jgi:acyl-CoA synthetase (AMP-forming)/AMP-acid ligase II
MYTALLHHPDRARRGVSSLKLSVSGGAPLPVKVLRGFGEAFGCKVLEGYGLSETTGMGRRSTSPSTSPSPGRSACRLAVPR